MKLRCLAALLLSLLLLAPGARAEGAPFVPEQPTVPAEELSSGERGEMLTVLRGTEPVSTPVEVVSVIPQKGEVRHGILIRLLPQGGERVELAMGMSGSPVYIKGRLAGAVSSGWEFSDHSLALVTPIADMCALFSREDGALASPGAKTSLSAPVAVSGLSIASASSLAKTLGLPLAEAPIGSHAELLAQPGRFRPGEAVAALLAWGDVDVTATGTVTATAKDGRFLAMGHSFLKRGNAAYPAAQAYIHQTVRSQAFPFKLASPLSIVGTFTQDREAGLGGRVGFFAPSIAAALSFHDLDLDRRDERRFRVVQDAFLSGKLLEGLYSGLIEDAWGRKGQGTMKVTLRVEGRGIEKGWTRSDIFFSEEDAVGTAMKPMAQLISTLLTQPFSEGMPLGFRLDVRATEEPRALLIEDIEAPDKARGGEDLPVTVTLRRWRGRTVRRKFTMRVPEGASGVCELVVRGGGVNSLSQLAVDGGWKAIDSLDRFLEELGAMDANNELILELQSDTIGDILAQKSKRAKKSQTSKGAQKKPQKSGADLLPEETEFLSETKARRIQEGTLRVFRSDCFVDGMMRRLVTVEDHDEG